MSEEQDLASPKIPSSPTPASSSAPAPSSLVAACSYRPQPFRRSPVKKNASSDCPPRSPSKEKAVSLTATPLTIIPNIAARLNPPERETVRTLVLQSSVRSLLQTLPQEDMAAFLRNNPKLCGHIVVESQDNSKKQRKNTKCGKCGYPKRD